MPFCTSAASSPVLFRFVAPLAAVLCLNVVAKADVINFDDIQTGRYYATISNGYAGFNWNNIYAESGTGGGYTVGVVSPANAAFNGGGSLGTVSSGTPFTLNNAYFTAAFNAEAVTVLGYVNGIQTYSSIFTVVSTRPTLETFNWSGLTSFTFIGGTGDQFTQVVIDNLAVNQPVLPSAVTPEPSSFALLGTGLLGIAGLVRKRLA